MARRSGGGQSVAAQSAEVEQHTRLVTLCPAVSMRERIIGMLTDAGAEVTGTSIDVGPDGQMIENTHVEFRPVAAEPAVGRGVMGRLRRRFSDRHRG